MIGFVAPKATAAMLIFALVMGLTGDATVSPTSALVSRRFGVAAMGFLFGMTFVCHQLGGFLSSWLGGTIIENGNVVLLWAADILLCALESLASFRIRVRSGE